MEQKVFVGFNYGTFTTDEGERRDYANAFMLEPFDGDASANYHFGGQRAMKYGCVGPEVWAGIDPGATVECYYNSKRKISKMVPVKKS